MGGSNWKYSYGLGKHIEGTGSRTNMAYYAPGYGTKINWYSNPDVMYKGVPTGTENENNARVLREHRFAFADIGDESMHAEKMLKFQHQVVMEETVAARMVIAMK